MQFDGKTVLISGAGAGIGRAIAQQFAEQGARVVALEKDPAHLAELKQVLPASAEHLLLEVDVTSAAQLDHAFSQINQQLSSLDVLVNNVGDSLGLFKELEQCTDDEFDQLYAINLRHVLMLTRRALPLLKQHRFEQASIVNVSSIEGFRGIPKLSVYAAMKAAITGLNKSLAIELAAYGIRVNLVAPETTETPQVPVSAFIKPEHRERIGDWIPLGRFGTPRDMSQAVLFLASDQASWITGTSLHVDGGALAAGGWYRTPQGGWTLAPVIAESGFIF